jgi:RNA polymerase sigma-70 factor (ECF subfamily)
MADDTPTTSLWLLMGLGDAENRDEEAWREFAHRYHGHILHWCRQAGLKDADAQDAAQEVLLRLMKVMRTFVYDRTKGRFRGFLRKTAAFAIGDVQRRLERTLPVLPDSGLETLGAANTATPDDLAIELEERLLRDAAMVRAKKQADSRDWQAFELRLAGTTQAATAQQLGMSTGWVNKACGRVMARIRRIAQELESA